MQTSYHGQFKLRNLNEPIKTEHEQAKNYLSSKYNLWIKLVRCSNQEKINCMKYWNQQK